MLLAAPTLAMAGGAAQFLQAAGLRLAGGVGGGAGCVVMVWLTGRAASSVAG